MKFILASKNAHKAKEFEAILGDGFEIITQDAAGFGHIDVVEDGNTFEENSLKKAETIMKASGFACIADDSGLCVDALDGAPGIYSARYSGENATDEQNVQKLLSALEGVDEENRTAHFVCVIAVSIPDTEPLLFRGECNGRILTSPQGNNGFGYDPVFFVPEYGVSMAELTPEIKNSVSHRFRALNKLKESLG